MIAKASWFSTRKYSGWGLSPNCWQGWVYLGVIIAPIVLINNLSLPGMLPVILMIVWSSIFAIDFIDIMIHVKRDERDTIHEALAERNAMWFMIMILAAGIAYQAAMSVVNTSYEVDPIILIALLGATVVKAATHWYLREK